MALAVRVTTGIGVVVDNEMGPTDTIPMLPDVDTCTTLVDLYVGATLLEVMTQ